MKNRTHILFALALFTIGIATSCADSHIYKGDRFYDNLAYSKAIPFYEKAYKKKEDKDIAIKLADSYYKTGQLNQSEAIYSKIVNEIEPGDIQNYNYAKVLMANNKHPEAVKLLENYLAVHTNDPSAQVLMTACKSVSDRYIDTTLYELSEIKTEGLSNAFSVAEYQDGIVFVGDKEVFRGKKKNPWTGESYLDLYHMKKSEDGSWLSPEVFKGDLNGRFHEGPATFSEDGNTVYFTRSNYFKRKMEINEERENNLKIFSSTKVDGKWTQLEEFPYNSDDYSVGHPTLSVCCNTLYFVSDMPGGYGGTDIYRSFLVDGKWSQPENLGSTVNTSGNEMFPYYDEDDALYFSSDAHNSMGGLDVFITSFNGVRWLQPENLNYPINSNKDDFGFTIDKQTRSGFVSSARADKDKIYSFKNYDPTFNLIGFTHEKGSEKPIDGVKVEITNRETGEIMTATSDEKGNFKIQLAPEKEYDLLCTKFGCFSRTDELSTKGLKYSTDFYADFEVEPIVIDKPIVLENIYYDFDKWNIRPDAAVELDKLVKILKDNPSISIEMGSHTDARGSDSYNLVLSDRRAYAAMEYLIKMGVSEDRLTWKGYGETILRNQCANNVECSDEEHQLNRRTEFKVTKVTKID